jgi:SAM-dependent methyltransferase
MTLPDRARSPVLPEPRLDRIENYPETADFVKKAVLGLESAHPAVADVGGGANPALDFDFVQQHHVDYTLLDISQAELDKAPAYFRKIQVDMTAAPEDFSARVGQSRFDIVCSHFFLEHVRDPIVVHRNIHSALKPGGLAIHFFPTPNSIPLAVNRLLPESVGQFLIAVFHPVRDLKGKEGKFPAYYRMCGNPSERVHAVFAGIGYDVMQHTGYIGHGYYDRFGPLRRCERAFRTILLNAKIPMTSDALLVLRKRSSDQSSG